MSLVYDRMNAYSEHWRLKSLAKTCTKIYFVDWLICGLTNGSLYYGIKFSILKQYVPQRLKKLFDFFVSIENGRSLKLAPI